MADLGFGYGGGWLYHTHCNHTPLICAGIGSFCVTNSQQDAPESERSALQYCSGCLRASYSAVLDEKPRYESIIIIRGG